MSRYFDLFGLDEEQVRAVERFHDYHQSCEANSDREGESSRPIEWHIGYDDKCLELVCRCGATLHLTEPIYVTVEPQRFKWADKALAKRVADEMVDSAAHPHMHMLLDPTPAGFFTYLYGMSKTYELANRDVFPKGFPQAVMRRFVEEACRPDCRDRGFDIAMEVCGSDDRAFEVIGRIVSEMVDEYVPEAASIDLSDEKAERMKWLHESGRGIAQESLFQSALVTLPEDTFEQIRMHPSTTEMHFGLGLYLRNRFVHSGLLWSGVDPDNQSSGATFKLIKYCIPEFREFDLVYNELGYGALYDAYRYCMEVRGELPLAEFTRHYGLLREAQKIDGSNPYSILDDEHYDEYRAWSDKAWDKRKQYKIETLHEVWNFDAIRDDLQDETAKECEEVCLAALNGERGGFMPSEVAYAKAGFTDERAMRAFIWAVEDYDVAGYLPDDLFARRELALVAVSRRGRQLERASLFKDDDEIVLAAVANAPDAIKFASERLQGDRRILIEAASHADSELIFYDEPMAQHNDDDELVGLAIDANGANIAYASERIRSDFDWAMRAVSNRRDIYPEASYEDLSDALKKDRRIALAVAKWNRMPSNFPDPSLADDDELGSALAQKDDHYALFGMSRRIKEKYMTAEELERWGDDPWWWHEDDEKGE